MTLRPFHLAFPVHDIDAARRFWGGTMGCAEGRSSVPRFGVVLAMTDWQALADRLVAAGIKFEIAPYVRFRGEPGEQATMFFRDPSGNAIEMKAFNDLGQLFAT